jgi:serpin B
MPMVTPRAPRAALLVAAAAALIGHAAPSSAGPAKGPVKVDLVPGQNAFALDLYARLRDEPGNVLFSAYSIQSALAMARAGARGTTATQMDRVLHLPPNAAPEAWQALVERVVTAPLERDWSVDGKESQVPAYSLSVANALFGQKGYAFVPAYRDLLASAYGAELKDVDFASGSAVRQEINDWVLAKTNQKIKDLIPEGLPTADTRLALVNAIHFLAQWAEPFREEATIDGDFTGAGGTKTKVRMMRRTASYRFAEDDEVRVAVFPYRGNAAELVVVLPKAVDGLAAVEKGLTPERVAVWAGGTDSRKLAVSLPRFRFEDPTDLSAHLAAMGMPDAFSPGKADFTGMAAVPGEPLFLGAVLHKAFIAVDEKGTEAAAATAVLMRAGSVQRPSDPIPFVCDHPFLFLLRHRATGALLFLGRLSAPESETAPAAGSAQPAR